MSVGKNTAYNLAGFLIPTALALATVPAYIALIGPARYGVLSLVWLILGYFGLFDLGLGRATTQRIAALHDAPPGARAIAFHTALVTNLLIGIVGSLILWLVSWIVFSRFIDMTPDLRHEAVITTPLLALALPIATTLGVLTGALVGRERFRLTNQISVTSTALFQLLPLVIAWKVSISLPYLVIASLLARCIGLLALWRCCHREFATENGRSWDIGQLRQLLGYGSWMTVSSMTIPLLNFTDRFIIGSILGPVAVTHYTVPMEAMRRLSGIATSLGGALFPRFATARQDQAQELTRYGVGLLYTLLTPVAVGGLFLMEPVLVLWLGDEIGRLAAPLGRLFLIAFWFNTFAQVPFTRLQAQGRPATVARIQLLELVPYIAGTWFATTHFGLIGAAWVFLGRMAVDNLLLFRSADVRLGRPILIGCTLVIMVTLALSLQTAGLSLRLLIPLAMLAGLLAAVPALIVLPDEIRRRIPLLARVTNRLAPVESR